MNVDEDGRGRVIAHKEGSERCVSERECQKQRDTAHP